jgi:hypothetical protein
MTSFR